MFYKAYKKKLENDGYTITDEGHGGNIYPHYFKYENEDDPAPIMNTIEFVCANNKNGTPGKILKMWQNGIQVL